MWPGALNGSSENTIHFCIVGRIYFSESILTDLSTKANSLMAPFDSILMYRFHSYFFSNALALIVLFPWLCLVPLGFWLAKLDILVNDYTSWVLPAWWHSPLELVFECLQAYLENHQQHSSVTFLSPLCSSPFIWQNTAQVKGSCNMYVLSSVLTVTNSQPLYHYFVSAWSVIQLTSILIVEQHQNIYIK